MTGRVSRRKTAPGGRAKRSTLPAWKKALFATVTVGGFFLILEGVLALAGVRPQTATADPYVGFAGNIPLYIEERGADGKTYMTTGPSKVRWFNRQRFLKDKPAGVYRIFSVGGSTTYGRPYTDPFSFSGWLREMLPEADPTRQWEVINAGGVSYASYRVAAVMEELSRYEPDLFIVYSGHNEFLERRSYGALMEAPQAVTWLGGLLSHTRIYTAGATLFPSEAGRQADKPVLAEEVDTILAHSAGPSEYHRDDAFRAKVLEHYEFNLRRMAEIAREAGARVVFVTPASNLKDCTPFKAEPSVDSARFDQLLANLPDEPAKRLEALDSALEIDPRRADLYFTKGRTLLDLGRNGEAREAFLRAEEEDVCPLRATPEMLDIVRQVARKTGARLVDFAAYIDDESEGVPGSEHFLDHVHLDMDGYRELALLLVDDMAAAGMLEKASSWNEQTIAKIRERVESRLDERQLAISLRNLALVLGWAGKTKEADRIARRALAELGDNADSYRTMGRAAAAAGRHEEAIQDFRRSLELDPRQAEVQTDIAVALLELGRVDEAITASREALRLDPSASDTHLMLGLALSGTGDSAGAIESFAEALRLDPRSHKAHSDLGAELMKLGRLEEALPHFEKALELYPEYTDALVNWGYALGELGQLDEAERKLRRALEIGPETAPMQFNLGVVLQRKNELEAAVDCYKRALELDPLLTGAHHNLAMALLALGRDEEAVNRLREALSRDPEFEKQYPEIRDAVLGKR